MVEQQVGASSQGTLGRAVVSLRLPADGAYLSVLRTTTGGLASRQDFTLDEIEDLRIAVDEACAMLLADASPGADLTCTFEMPPDEMAVSVRVLSQAGRVPSTDTFAWTVLSALAGDVHSEVDADGAVVVHLRKRRAAA